MPETQLAQNVRDAENRDALVGKAALGLRRVPGAARPALSNVSNVNGGLHKLVTKAALQTKTSVKPVETKPKNEELSMDVCPVSPAPMETSTCAVTPAFSRLLVEDIDKDDHDNPQLVAEYVNDIYAYMRTLERSYAVKENYLEGTSLNPRMRAILIDWLVQVHLRFHLLQETLYLTVAIIDRFLELQSSVVKRNKLQLVGVAAMLVASKYEEMYAPEIGDFVYITDNAYSKAEIRKMERDILSSLGFQLGNPLPLHFLRRNSKAGECDATTHTLAKYLMELTITEYTFVHRLPSLIAAAALYLSMKVFCKENGAWSDTLHHYSTYSESDLMPVVRQLANLLKKAGSGKLKGTYEKYRSSKFMRISTYPEIQSSVVSELASS